MAQLISSQIQCQRLLAHKISSQNYSVSACWLTNTAPAPAGSINSLATPCQRLLTQLYLARKHSASAC